MAKTRHEAICFTPNGSFSARAGRARPILTTLLGFTPWTTNSILTDLKKERSRVRSASPRRIMGTLSCLCCSKFFHCAYALGWGHYGPGLPLSMSCWTVATHCPFPTSLISQHWTKMEIVFGEWRPAWSRNKKTKESSEYPFPSYPWTGHKMLFPYLSHLNYWLLFLPSFFSYILLLSCLICGLSSALFCMLCKKPSLITWRIVIEIRILNMLYNCDLTLLYDWIKLALWKDRTQVCAFIACSWQMGIKDPPGKSAHLFPEGFVGGFL